ncbi:MAG: Polyribonucleotide nucleotidyltransferase, partial [candidate division WS6 bacterium GW2011_GWA2_37_6]
EAVLKARQVDHSIRSLFPKGFKRGVNVVITVLSYDDAHDPADLAVTAASVALMISPAPFNGPSASVSVGIQKDGKLIINPKNGDRGDLEGHYIVGIKADRVLNIEGWSNEAKEDKLNEVIDLAAEKVKPLYKFQEEFAKKFGVKKYEYEEEYIDKEILEKVEKDFGKKIEEGLFSGLKRQDLFIEMSKTIVEENEGVISKENARNSVEYLARKYTRKSVLEHDKRLSGRGLDEIRKINAEAGVLPRVHGSALFTRGMTQAMSIVTLGSTRLSQTLESFEGEEEKGFMHHYNGPSYSTGEGGRFSYYPGRREIGHGHITESAIKAVLPSEEEFPYTIRVVSEILSQNGSSSMAAACGTSLALMDAGVPIKKAIGGIAVGLVTDDEDVMKYKILTDIEGAEDFYGDMDFKVVGTKDGITAIQLDNKLEGVPIKILKEALQQSKRGRDHVLEQMEKVLNAPRAELSQHAPKVDIVKVDPGKLGDLIGPGGKTIKGIIEQCEEFGEIDIDIQDSGDVYITSVIQEARDKAIEMIKEIFEEAEIGKTYDGVVDRVENYGAFVNVTKNITGLVHVSEMAEGFVKDAAGLVKFGDKVKVKVIGIDELGRVKLSMKGLNPEIEKKATEQSASGGQSNSGGDRPDSRGSRSSGNFRDSRGPRSSSRPTGGFNNRFQRRDR